MRYYLDCEFNGYRGALMSLALVRDDGRELYLVEREAWKRRILDFDPWVQANVLPILKCAGADPAVQPLNLFASAIEAFMLDDAAPVVAADWPDDIRYFCECLITGPGEMIDIPPAVRNPDDPLLTRRGHIQFEVHRVDAYPTELAGAVQHNALWDARALRQKLTGR